MPAPSWKVLAVLLVLFAACGSQIAGQLLRDAGDALADSGNAHAQTPSSCQQWEVQRIIYDNVPTVRNDSTTSSTFAGGAISIPDGWEPFGGTSYGGSSSFTSSAYLLVRRCTR
jgi:hypothetical protein